MNPVTAAQAEPAGAAGVLVAVVNAAQIMGVSAPSWLHALIVVLTALIAAVGVRTQVSPNTNSGV